MYPNALLQALSPQMMIPGGKTDADPAMPMGQTMDPGAAFPPALRNVQLSDQQQAQRAFPEYGPEDAMSMWRRDRVGAAPQMAAPQGGGALPQGGALSGGGASGVFDAVSRALQQQGQR